MKPQRRLKAVNSRASSLCSCLYHHQRRPELDMSVVFLSTSSDKTLYKPGMVGLAPKWVRLAPNGTNPGNLI